MKSRSREQIKHDISTSSKVCVSCGVRKDFSSFTKQTAGADGRSNVCMECLKEYRKATKERTSVYKKQYNIDKREHIRYKRLRDKYGVDEEWYIDTLEKQGNACAICGATEAKGNGNKHFHVDHCHTTGTVRGLLCAGCNTGLGNFKDSEEMLSSAINYLNKFKGK